MKKVFGFSLIELLIVIGVTMILALISVPEMSNWYKKDRFIFQADEIIDTIYDARAAALSEKKCSNGNSSTMWGWVMFNHNINLICHDSVGENNDKTINLDDNITFAKSFLHFQDSETLLWIPLDTNTKVSINFVSGNAEAYITVEDGVSRGLYNIRKIKLPFGFSGVSDDIERTICFDRIAGFPTISLNENCYD